MDRQLQESREVCQISQDYSCLSKEDAVELRRAEPPSF